jgi:DNA repair protein RecN (Recombination protein N)
MLLDLRIENFALIERSEIAPGPGFNVLTGETGAGKSILIQALGLLLGERAGAEQVGPGAVARALIEGAFDISGEAQAAAWLEEHEYPGEDGQLIIRREVGADGRSRVRLNNRLATAAALRDLGDLLVDLHGQHEHQVLMRPEAHLGYLDAYGDAGHAALRAQVRAAYEEHHALERRLAELEQDEATRAQRLDMLGYQIEEIDNAAVEVGEDDRLSEERLLLLNSEKLRDAAALCRDCLMGEEEPGALTLARQALQAAREIEALDPSVSTWTGELQSAIFELEDAAGEALSYAQAQQGDPRRLEEIESRLHSLTRLKRKYGPTLEAIAAYREKIGAEHAGLGLSQEEREALGRQAQEARARYEKLAGQLSEGRRRLAQKFTVAVVEQLHDLAIAHARFEVGFTRDEKGNAGGRDRVEFLFNANPGQPLRPLARIASGGEISRVMLALRSVLRERGDDGAVPIVIFDEIDVGIGGLTAEAVGQKMSEIARRHQVFCITHLPQIAKRAAHHFRVEKSSADDSTHVEVVPLGPEERVREIARMMGSESPQNIEHARVLLRESQAG